MSPSVLILIPAFNEGPRIGTTVRGARTEFPGANVLVVNDASTDNTRAAAEEELAEVVTHRFNLGYGASLQTGFKYAMAAGYEYVVQMDGDGQHDPAYIEPLLGVLKEGESDIVLGSRFLFPMKFRSPAFRRLGSRLLSSIVALLTGRIITDPTTGFQALNRKALREYCRQDFPSDYPDADVLIRSIVQGLRILEIPVRMFPADAKSIHSGLRPVYYAAKMLLSIPVSRFALARQGKVA